MRKRSETSGSSVGDVGRNILFSSAANLMVPAVGLLTAPILAQSLGVVGRGELASIIAPFLLLSTVAMFGIPEAANHFVAKYPEGVRRASSISLILSLVASGLIASCFIVSIYRFLDVDVSYVTVLVISAWALVPTIFLSVCRAISAGMHNWFLVNLEKYVSAFLRVIVLVAFAGLGILTVASAALVMILAPVVAGSVYLILLRQRRPVSLKRDAFERVGAFSILSFSGRAWVGSLSGIILARVDQVLLIPLSDSMQLGLYAAAVSVAEVVLVFNTAVRDVLFSAESAETSAERLYKASTSSLLASLIVAIPLALSLPVWFPLAFGTDFAPGVPTAAVLILASVLGVPGSVGGAGLGAWGRPGLRSISLLVSAVCNVGALFILAPMFGSLGAAYATLVGNLVAANLNLIFLRLRFGCSFWRFYAVSLADVSRCVNLVRRLRRRNG